RGEYVGRLHLAAGQRLEGDRAGLVQRVEALEGLAVDVLQADDAVRAGLELRRASDDEVLRVRRQVGNRLQVVLVRGRLRDGDRVGVDRRRRAEDLHGGRQLGRERGVHLRGRPGG